MRNTIRLDAENESKSYRNRVDDSQSHHGRLPENQEAANAEFILHVKKHFGHLDTDLEKNPKT